MKVAILYQRLLLPTDHPDYASEVGVLESVQAVRRALEAAAHECWEVTPATAGELFAMLEWPRPDVVVNLVEGFAGQSRHEAHVAGVLELLGLPYTGSPPACLSLVHNKARAKRVLMAHHLPTPEFVAFGRRESPRRDVLAGLLREGPMIVKPVAEDASLGIGPDSVVTKLSEALERIAEVQQRYGDVMIERYIEGREFNVGIVALPAPHALPLAEIDFQRDDPARWPIVTYDSKWAVGSVADRITPVRCPADVEPGLAARIYRAAINAFCLTGCRDYGRVDLRVNDRGEPFILEVNANPDIGPAAGFPQALEADNIEYDEFVQRLVATAAARKSEVGDRSAGHAPLDTAHGQPQLNGNGKPQIPNPKFQIPNLRPFVADDRAGLLDILRACEMFRPDEIEVADEILQESIRDGAKAGYRIMVAEQAGQPVGWACYGLVPLTDASYDLYWIAVAPAHQNTGIGRQLLAECEETINALGGRWLLAETSSTAHYDSTRAFYARCGFQIVTSVPDYYRAGDGLVTFGKRLENTALCSH